MGGAINSTGWNNPSVAPDLTSCCGIPFYIRAIALLFYLMSHLTHLCTQTWYSRSKASNICIIPVEFCCLIYLIMKMFRELCRFVRVRGFGEILLTDIANVCGRSAILHTRDTHLRQVLNASWGISFPPQWRNYTLFL